MSRWPRCGNQGATNVEISRSKAIGMIARVGFYDSNSHFETPD
jgi:hypothetical protein